jgi:hypothetical protein
LRKRTDDETRLLGAALGFSVYGYCHQTSFCMRNVHAEKLWMVVNNFCPQPIQVRWIDQGVCRTGCEDGVGPFEEQAITAPTGIYRSTECEGKNCSPPRLQ